MALKRLERNLIHLDSVDSTNEYAANLLRTSQLTSGTIIWSDSQRLGKGQRSSSWTVEDNKNLTCSIIICEPIPAKQSFYLNIVASLAVRKALEDLGLSPEIKWPNDILIAAKKVSGILIENQISGTKISSSVIGIGINVNQSKFVDLPNATSIYLETKRQTDLKELLDQLYSYLDFYLDHLLQSNTDLLKKHYYNHLYLLNETAQFEDANGKFIGKIVGIDSNGLLEIQSQKGTRTFDIKEIVYCS